MTHPCRLAAVALLCLAAAPLAARATGYEKPAVVSGRYAGLAGAAVSGVGGPESLLFNPAGLATSPALELELAGSPFLSRKAGPVLPRPGSATQGSDSTWGDTVFAMPGAALLSARVAPGLGVGLGYFAVAGGGGKYGDLDLGPAFPALRPELAGGVGFDELSLGAGYEVLPGLRIGAAWRVTFVRGFSRGAVPVASGAAGPAPDTIYALDLRDLSATRWTGLRLGAQYEAARWGVGAGLRTKVAFTARGKGSALAERAGSPEVTAVPGGAVTLASALPWQVAIGGHVLPTRSLRVVAQYELTRSSENRELRWGGDAIGALDPSALTSPVDWRDMHTFRVGVEHAAARSAALRAGYAVSTQVTRDDRANYGLIPPGPSHTFTFGVGQRFRGDSIGVDAALDLSRSEGRASGSVPGFLDGDYRLWAATLHAGASYRF